MPLPIVHLELNGPGAAAAARSAARRFLGSGDAGTRAFTPVARDTALPVINELATHAVRHTSGGCVLELHKTPDDGLDVDVSDTSSADPRPRTPRSAG
ncbi:ATP-binding protein [Streptomyces virginiae]|uniref:ATP-binding protein n=1 Tax=Streptomyces virginiae TaxID=1961 RepID=A0ABZ1TPD1_STRVG|nr:ATP-binding protein [Streptomyces virginiae]